MSDGPREDAVNRAEQLAVREDAAGGPDALVKSLVDGFARLRRQSRLVVAGLILDITLSVLAGAGVVVLNSVTHRVERNSQTANVACRSANDLRAADKRLWEYVLNQPPTQQLSAGEAAARKKLIANVQTELDKNLSPLACVQTK